MFHSSGFFSGLLCPFYEHGLCHRPYCHYRHSRRERPHPSKRPQLKTKYTSYPSSTPTSEEPAASETTLPAAGKTEGEEDGEKEKQVADLAVFNFYGANRESEAGGAEDESGKDIGTDHIADEEPGAEVELPCYAPEVCIETVVGIRDTQLEEISEKEVKEPPPPEVEPVTVEVMAVPVETELAPPNTDDITEADIFGSTDDDAPDDRNMREDEREKAAENDGGESKIEERGEEREREGEETEGEAMKSVFQQAIETQTATGSRKRPASSTVDYPSTLQKKKRIALPNAELYRQNASSAVKRTPTITSRFAATLDKDSLYMGRKRMALTLKPVSPDHKLPAPPRPTIPLRANSKVPTRLRQKYLDSYIDEILKVTFDPLQAYKKAEKEEAELFEKCSSRMTYCSRASQTLQRLRKESREFQQKQREASDTRVQAHNDSRSNSTQTTPTSGRGPAQTTSTSGKPTHLEKRPKSGSETVKKKKQVVKMSATLSSSPLSSPTSLSPTLVERCRSVEVRVKKYAPVVPEETSPGEPASSPVHSGSSTRSFYSTPTDTSNKESREKVQKAKKVKKGTTKGKIKATAKKDGEIVSSPNDCVVISDKDPLESQMMVGGGGGGGGDGNRDPEIMMVELFGDSDSECVALSSPCTSGEEEIMNISFEDALRGAESGGRGRGRRRGRGKMLQKGRAEERQKAKRERIGSGEGRGRERLGSSGQRETKREKPKKVAVGKRTEPRRRNSVEEPPANFKPDSHTLINLTAVAAKATIPSSSPSSFQRSSSASLQRSNSELQRPGRILLRPPLPPPSSTSLPRTSSFSTFKNTAVTLTAPVFYSLMKSYLMTQEQLLDNGYPLPTEKLGVAAINWGGENPTTIQPVGSNAMRHRCCRCGKNFIIYDDGKYQTVEECLHHYGRLLKVKEYGEGIVSQYSCCSERRDSIGCHVAKFHVTAGARPKEVTGYVQTTSTFPSPSPSSSSSSSSSSKEKVYALDCEMCYTTAGLELTRVSVVDMDLQPVYEAIVLPPRPIVDYNTRFSGLTAEDFASGTVYLEEVQEKMLAMVSADTILLGHSLESDLRALKIIHERVVDTALVFPHRRGPPLKRALRNLMKDHLNKIIQDDVDGGHDSLEDARACMELMLWKTRQDLQKTTRRVAS